MKLLADKFTLDATDQQTAALLNAFAQIQIEQMFRLRRIATAAGIDPDKVLEKPEH